MARDSKIEWTHHTANLWHGCTKVTAGCDHCYAETLSKRWKRDIWGNDVPRMMIRSVWNDLSKYQKLAAAAGEIHRVFVGSMMDIFEKPMPLVMSDGTTCTGIDTDHLRRKLFNQITDGLYPNLLFLLLTKRPSNIIKYIPESWKDNPPDNVMFGYSPVNEPTLREVRHLLKVKGRNFLSIEPMLEPIIIPASWIEGIYRCPQCGSFNCMAVGTDEEYEGMECRECDSFCERLSGIDWIICGGESGPKRRPFDMEAARKLRDDCLAAGIPFFMKQIDKVIPIPDDLIIRQFPVIN